MPILEDFVHATYERDAPLKVGEPDNESLKATEESNKLAPKDAQAITQNGEPNGVHEVPKQTIPGMKCAVKTLYEKNDLFGGSEWVETIPDGFLQQNTEQWDEFAVLLRMHFVDGKQRLHSIVVQSPILKAKLKQVFSSYPGVFLGKSSWTAEAPFKPFVHRWKEFVAVCETKGESEMTRHLQLLRSALEPELQQTFTTISEFKAGGAVEFTQLWMVFNPGTTIFTAQKGTECAYKLLRTELYLSKEQNKKFFLLHCCCVDYDGKKMGYALHMEAIPEYEDYKVFTELGVYPLEVHPEVGVVTKKLVQRGRKFESLAGVAYRVYDGHGTDLSEMPPVKHYIKGRIVIDAASCIRFRSAYYVFLGALDFAGTAKKSEDEQHAEPDAVESSSMYASKYFEMDNAISRLASKASEVKLTEDQLLICKHSVRGYSLKIKKWLEFELDSVQYIQWNDRAWESLVLADEYKNSLMAFARTQHTEAAQFDDVIEGKGRGMVILLEGPPGVGKTLTVESVAEEMKAPLYSISPGDLGTEPDIVQIRLREALETAELWKAVVLLDEADIFLEKRDVNYLKRNQLVSVFLQTLEYFKGTVFLTTNRVETMDHAFQSRIHVTMTYSKLTPESRRTVWKNFIQSLQVDNSAITDDEIRKLAEKQMNGRQIKNVVKMAGLLAADNKGKLEPQHLQTVMRIGNV